MKSVNRLVFAASALIILAQFSSQDSTVSGGAKPAVNFYGKVTDLRETFNAENITIDRLYKAIPVYQQAPLASSTAPKQDVADGTIKKESPSYDPTDNITRLDLAEIKEITVSPNQRPQRFGNRDYIVIDVYSKDAQQTKNSYIIESDKKLFFDQKNPAGPIEKEIKLRAALTIEIEGYKEQDPTLVLASKKSHAATSKKPTEGPAKRFISYVKNAFGFHVTL